MFEIKSKVEHAVLDIKVAMKPSISKCAGSIADSLNEMFRSNIENGDVADYIFYNSDNPTKVMASSIPVEGELFPEKANQHTELLNDFAREMLAFCKYRTDKSRPLDESHIDLPNFVNDFMKRREMFSGVKHNITVSDLFRSYFYAVDIKNKAVYLHPESSEKKLSRKFCDLPNYVGIKGKDLKVNAELYNTFDFIVIESRD